jgi:phage terminase large subunit-like protein
VSPDPLEQYRRHLEVMAAASSEQVRGLYRRRITESDPLMFALVYLRHHLRDDEGRITLSEVHLAWVEAAKRWMQQQSEPMANRHAEVAPREMGKSTWWFLILPMWAAAHGHRTFAAAFANTPEQAETHLASFKSELDNNPLIRADYPELVEPKTRGRGVTAADRISLYHARSGFVFAARGIDTATLGLKVGNKRPDLLILDDIEPHEGRYSADAAAKRLDTLRSAILPLNIRAAVVIVGTVTMVGSIVHQLVKSAGGVADPVDEAWIDEERIEAHHHLAIVTDDDGRRRSIWPEKWSLAFLESIEGSRSYAKNYANDPRGADGDYWTLDDITTGTVEGITRVLVSIDPAVTTKKTSDYTGISVIGWRPPRRDEGGLGECEVREVRQVRKTGEALRLDVLATLERHNAGLVLVETNQGGELWQVVLHNMPVKVKTVHQTEAKETRAADVLTHYQRGRVKHSPDADLRDYEGQLVAFPRAPHDDMVDSTGSGIRYFLSRNRTPAARNRVRVGASASAY